MVDILSAHLMYKILKQHNENYGLNNMICPALMAPYHWVSFTRMKYHITKIMLDGLGFIYVGPTSTLNNRRIVHLFNNTL